MAFARAVATRVAYMEAGRIAYEDAPGPFFDRPGSERLKEFLSRM
jgi:ABC-type polar amino acid transport system ATPase subunit